MGPWWFTAAGTFITGCCYSFQKYLQWRGYQLPKRVAYYIDGASYYFKTLLVFLLMRSFVVEWAIAPSESLKPTLLLGDRVLTDKAAYGLRLPITGHMLIALNTPKRGDVIVFRSPADPSKGLINRLIGLPGDRIEYRNKILTINGKQVPQRKINISYDEEVDQDAEPLLLYEEKLEGCIYKIYMRCDPVTRIKAKLSDDKPVDLIVPAGHYFVMGDHRDYSIDSRSWGCVPDRYLLGKARRVYLSRRKPTTWWKLHTWVRWRRFAMKIR